MRGFADRLPAAAITLAETYRDAGYATLALSSVLFTGQFTNLHQGYEELHESGSTETPSPKTARVYVDRIDEWLQVHRDVPFFIYLHVFDTRTTCTSRIGPTTACGPTLRTRKNTRSNSTRCER